MQPSTRNALANAGNRYQTDAQRVLTVCSAGMLRSPSLANHLHTKYGYNTRACGSYDYALVPMSEVLVEWADTIIFVNPENFNLVVNNDAFQECAVNLFDDNGRPKSFFPNIIVANIPDNFSWMHPELVEYLDSIPWNEYVEREEDRDKVLYMGKM